MTSAVSSLRQQLIGDFTKLLQQTSRPIQAPTRWKESAEGLVETQRSRFIAPDEDVGDWVLAVRPADIPSILEELKPPIDLMIRNPQSPGDILMLTAAIRDLHLNYPGKFRTAVSVQKPCRDIFLNNPFITHLERNAPTTNTLQAHYSLHGHSNQLPYHFIHGFRKDFENRLGLPIEPTCFHGDIHLTEEEKVCPLPQLAGTSFWIIDAGCKSDYTNKLWEIARFQKVVEWCSDIVFVQVGASDKGHRHAPLQGKNVINLVGKTSVRDCIRLMYHAFGVVTPVSFPMHLAAAVEMHPRFQERVLTNDRRIWRPCVVIAGGREPSHWEAYPTHAYLHTCGRLSCCLHGGCWQSRIERAGDGDSKDTSLCYQPVVTPSGQSIPRCLDMITVEQVVEQIRYYQKAFGV